jgi:hypothetical protein
MRDHEHKRDGTVTLMAGIDLLSAQVHALVKGRHRSREFIEFLKPLDAAHRADTWLLSASAGTRPVLTAHSNIVPVAAHGRVYVASCKQLDIFGLRPASASAAQTAGGARASRAAGAGVIASRTP